MADEKTGQGAAASTSGQNMVREPNFFNYYANHAQIESTAFDLKIVIGQFDNQRGTSTIRPQLGVTIGFAEAKALCHFLFANIAFYEAFNGHVKMPRGLTPQPLTLDNPE